jgi:hypothetical protein
VTLVLAVAPHCRRGAKCGVANRFKVSTALGPAYAQGKAGEIWATLIRERSAGRLLPSISQVPLVQRDPVREYAALRDGRIDLAVDRRRCPRKWRNSTCFRCRGWFPTMRRSRRLARGRSAGLSARLDVLDVVTLACAERFQRVGTRCANPPTSAG